MASEEMNRFFQYLAKHPDAQDHFKSIEDTEQAVQAAEKLATENGFDISAAEMGTWLTEQTAGEGKLSAEQLEQVAGGSACWTKTGYDSCPCDSGYCSSGC